MDEISKLIDYSQEFNMPDKVTKNFVDRVYDYLQEYPLITELNAKFLAVSDFENDKRLNKILELLNKKDNDSYRKGAPFTDEIASIKCIYNYELIDDSLSKVASVLGKDYLKRFPN
ncbi:hypothetical protein DN432_00885 [Lactobacillus reuteri]|jgi:hypothetical protein|uniref:hypothetical protein n=1 Tax=Limosilactobacillus reuteri TaxID=1598 RepID=UPI000BEEF3B8|nr:hypothetical protein [Limosilactobacillus reuteri]MQB92385.1 hypothetical protein [Limosilactobacillus reuteri]PEH08163.1 hypothetical protein CP354_04970 [Lactobacillus sp. UMNPBX3]